MYVFGIFTRIALRICFIPIRMTIISEMTHACEDVVSEELYTLLVCV